VALQQRHVKQGMGVFHSSRILHCMAR